MSASNLIQPNTSYSANHSIHNNPIDSPTPCTSNVTPLPLTTQPIMHTSIEITTPWTYNGITGKKLKMGRISKINHPNNKL